MNVTRDEAAQALNEVGAASVHIRRLRYYRASAWVFVMWGMIWVVANLAVHFDRSAIIWAWWVTGLPGVVASWWFGNRQRKLENPRRSPEQRAEQPNWFYIVMGVWLSLAAFIVVAWPLEMEQTNSLISLALGGAYFVSGAWLGWRLGVVGIAVMAATLVGYLMFKEFYFLWMAGVGGGALILSGAWLRFV